MAFGPRTLDLTKSGALKRIFRLSQDSCKAANRKGLNVADHVYATTLRSSFFPLRVHVSAEPFFLSPTGIK